MSNVSNLANSQLALPGVEAEAQVEWTWAEDDGDSMQLDFVHATIMKSEVVSMLAPESGVYIDATLGGGGHAEALLAAAPGIKLIGIDRDPVALAASKLRLAPFGDRVRFVHATFGSIANVLAELGETQAQGLCADLGVSSPQLDDGTRGMSFRREGPIDMRMDTTQGETALEMIERMSDDELADVLFRYGEERRSRRIARSIKRALTDGELQTTLDLRRAIVRAVGPARIGGVDPATRSFQGLRIAVNGELDELETLLDALPTLLAPGGRAAIISFHSLEDRQVKHTFQQRELWAPLTKKPVTATDEEAAENSRARSAKLRVATRLPL